MRAIPYYSMFRDVGVVKKDVVCIAQSTRSREGREDSRNPDGAHRINHLPVGVKPRFDYRGGKGPDGLGQWGDAWPIGTVTFLKGTSHYDPVLVCRSTEHSLFSDLLMHPNIPITTVDGSAACQTLFRRYSVPAGVSVVGRSMVQIHNP